MIAFCCYAGWVIPSGADELDDLLEDWVVQNVYFEKNQDGGDTLFVRKEPVRIYLESDDPKVLADTRVAVANLSEAFGLQYEFTSKNVNLMVVVANGITIDGKPNRNLLHRLKVPEVIVETIAKSDQWSKGCGVYAGHDKGGRIAIGMVFAEKSASEDDVRTCVATGIIFGFGLRVSRRTALDEPHDYVQFLLLARAITRCEKNAIVKREEELKCIRDRLRATLADQ
jgi:hypothetical protein